MRINAALCCAVFKQHNKGDTKVDKNPVSLNNQKTLLQRAWISFRRTKILYLMLMPAVLFTIIFSYIPMGGVIIAFKDYKYNLGIIGSPWVGLQNFKYFVTSGKMWLLTRNTLAYNLMFMAADTIFQIFMAILISEMCTKYYKRVLQSVMMLPHFLSWVIIGGLAYSILNYEFGTLNMILTNMGLDRVDVYNNSGVWKGIFLFVRLWQGTGYGMIFYLAAITGINPELYEAAYLDGCGLIKRIRYVTLPMILPTVCILILLGLGGILKGNMDMYYQLVGDNANLYDATDVIDTYVFRSLTKLKDYTVTTAAGLYQQVIGFILVITVNMIVKRIDPDSAIF